MTYKNTCNWTQSIIIKKTVFLCQHTKVLQAAVGRFQVDPGKYDCTNLGSYNLLLPLTTKAIAFHNTPDSHYFTLKTVCRTIYTINNFAFCHLSIAFCSHQQVQKRAGFQDFMTNTDKIISLLVFDTQCMIVVHTSNSIKFFCQAEETANSSETSLHTKHTPCQEQEVYRLKHRMSPQIRNTKV